MTACPFCAEHNQDSAIVCNHCNRALTEMVVPRWHSRAMWRLLGLGAATFAVLLAVLLVSAFVRTDATQSAAAAAALAPVTLTDVIENLPANSWRAIPLKLPYAGTLRVEVDVVRGNPLNAYVVSAEEFSAFQQNDAAAPRTDDGFSAVNMKTFHREGEFTSGDYYVLMVDPARGLPSSSASDVAVQVQLRP